MSRLARNDLLLHVALFVATCATTYLAGGVEFAATLMTILVVHESGHYIAARIHKIDASPPFFIPLPPQISLGTMGAVIRMRGQIVDRNQLFDVGVSGPLAGLAVAIPLLFIGVLHSPLELPKPGSVTEGNSILYILIKYVATGRLLPAADGSDVTLGPMAIAAWVGLLITMINLIPIGQLDGGHVARALLGNRHEALSRRWHQLLPIAAIAVFGWLWLEATTKGLQPMEAAPHALQGAVPWLVWWVLLTVMRRVQGGEYHPAVGDLVLTPTRRRIAWATFVVFLLIFTPVPMRATLLPR